MLSKLKAKKVFRLRPKEERGSFDDPTAQLEAFYGIYAEFSASFKEKTAEESAAFIEHFNALDIDSADGKLGDTLASGKVEDLKFEVGTWDVEDIRTMLKELAEHGYIEVPEDDD